MRYLFPGVLGAAGIAIGWLLTSRVTLEEQFPDRFLFDGGQLKFGPFILYLMTTEYKSSAALTISESGKVSLTHLGKSFPLGPGRSIPSRTGLPAFEFTPDAGDTVRLTRERSLLMWPVFELNFMTGSAPYARRHVYCRLTWKKRNRANLELLWRADQGYFGDSGWRPEKVAIMTSNLVVIKVGEATDFEHAAVEYLRRTKHWDRSEYRLEDRGSSSDGHEQVMFALHREDEHSPHPGAGRSVELRLSCESGQVMREIAGQ